MKDKERMNISLRFDPEVLIGSDTLSMAGTIASRHGKRIMIAADHALETRLVSRLKEILEDSGLDAIIFDGIEEDSSVEMSENIVELSRAAHCDAIIGFGGSKAQIIARMAAIMAPMRLSAFELMDGRLHPGKFLPLLAIPTEGLSAFSLADYFIVTDPRSRMISLIQSPAKLYTAVIIDNNIFNFNPGTGAAPLIVDGFLTTAEAYCSAKANFLSDIMLERALGYFAKLLKTPGSNALNTELFAQAGFLASFGAALSSPGLGSALSAAIIARCPAAKTTASAALFPQIAERLVSARPEKMARVASFMGLGKAASVADTAKSTIDGITRAIEANNLQTNLKTLDITIDRLTAASETARKLEFVTNSPWTVSEEEIFGILKAII